MTATKNAAGTQAPTDTTSATTKATYDFAQAVMTNWPGDPFAGIPNAHDEWNKRF